MQRMQNAGYAGIPTGGNPNYGMIQSGQADLPQAAPLQAMGMGQPSNPAMDQEKVLRQLGQGAQATGYRSQKAPSVIPLDVVLSNADNDYNLHAEPVMGSKYRALNAEVSGPFAGGELSIQGGAGRSFGTQKSPLDIELGAKYTRGFAEGGAVDGQSLVETIGPNTQQQINGMMASGGLAAFAKGGDVDVNDYQAPLQQQQPSGIDVLRAEFAKRGLDFEKFVTSPPVMKQALSSAQKMGIDGDTMLAHINPREAKMLKEHGGSGEINPHTGLPMFADNTTDSFRLFTPPSVTNRYGYGPSSLFYKYLDQKPSPYSLANNVSVAGTTIPTTNQTGVVTTTGGGGGDSRGSEVGPDQGPSPDTSTSTPGVSNLSSGTMSTIGGLIGSTLGGAIAGPLGSIAGGLLGRSQGISTLSDMLGLPSLSGYPSAPIGTPTPTSRPGDLTTAPSPSVTGPSKSAPATTSKSAPSVDVAEDEAQVQALEQSMISPDIATIAEALSTTSPTATGPATSVGGALGNTTSGGFGLSGPQGGLTGANTGLMGPSLADAMAAAVTAAQDYAAAQQAAQVAAEQEAAAQAAASAANNAAQNAQSGFGGGIMGGSFGAPGDVGQNNDVSGKGQLSGPDFSIADAISNAMAGLGAMANAQASSTADTTGQTGGNTTAGTTEGPVGSNADVSGKGQESGPDAPGGPDGNSPGSGADVASGHEASHPIRHDLSGAFAEGYRAA